MFWCFVDVRTGGIAEQLTIAGLDCLCYVTSGGWEVTRWHGAPEVWGCVGHASTELLAPSSPRPARPAEGRSLFSLRAYYSNTIVKYMLSGRCKDALDACT